MKICRNIGKRSEAFTLLEVILALMIAVGLLIAGIFLYQQASNLRTQLIVETERLGAIRLIMDRMTAELQTTRPQSGNVKPLTGGSNFVEFIKTDVPSRAAWNSEALGRAAFPEFDLRLVRYSLSATNGTNATAFVRSDEPALKKYAVSERRDLADASAASITNQIPLTSEIRFAQFRFWNGQAWEESWDKMELPRAVEVSLANDEMDGEIGSTNNPVEIFRRIIYLPASKPSDNSMATNLVLGSQASVLTTHQ